LETKYKTYFNDVKQYSNTSGDEREDVPKDVFVLDPASLPTEIFLSLGQLDKVHKNLFMFKSAE
jgi:hypothetical protein